VANPSPAKVSVECPHCGFKQTEYAAAKSSLCRQCGHGFSPFAPKADLNPPAKEETSAVEDPSIVDKFKGFWKRRRNLVVECFECNGKREVSNAASSTTCPACRAHIDISDYKITTRFNRTIRTRGDLHITAKGDLNSTTVVCNSALIEGKLRGNLYCYEDATINFVGKLPGRLTARHVTIERKADLQCFRRMRVESIAIKGKMSGEIIAQTIVTVHKKGSLEGNVTSKAITVEKGGIFSGELVIGQADLGQGELLPDRKPAASAAESDIPVAVPQPLPAA